MVAVLMGGMALFMALAPSPTVSREAGLVAGGGFLAVFARALRASGRSDPSPRPAAPGANRPPE